MHSSTNSPVVSEYQCELLGVGQLSEEDGYAVARRGEKGNIEEVRQPNQGYAGLSTTKEPVNITVASTMVVGN